MNALRDIFSPKLAILAGAGVSVDAPSSLPTSQKFLTGLFEALSFNNQSAGDFRIILRELNKDNPLLRFEKIISLLQRYFDPSLSLIDCFGDSKYPNYLHYFLAEMAKNNNIVMTTNFDLLIEIALATLNYHFLQIIEEKDFNLRDPANAIKIFKLHGSNKRYYNGKVTESKDTVEASLEQIGKQGLGLTLSPNKRDFLSITFRENDLFVIGYSGSDDFDISSLLELIPSNKKLIWLDHCHQDNYFEILSGEAIISAKTSYNSSSSNLLKNVIVREIRSPENVFLIRTNSVKFIKENMDLFKIDDYSFPKDSDEFRFDSRNYFETKTAQLRLNSKGDIYFLKGLLDEELNENNSALQAYQKSLSYFREKGNYEKISQIIHQMSSLEILMANLSEFESLAWEAEEIDRKYRPEWHPLALSLLGTIYKERRQFEASKKYYLISLEEAFNNRDDYAAAISLNNLGQMFNIKGEFDRGRQHLLEAAEIFERLGYLKNLAVTQRFIAVSCMEMREFAEANIFLDESKLIYEKLYDYLGKAYVLHEKAIFLQKNGQFDEAMPLLNESIDLCNKFGDNHTESLGLYHLAVSETMIGNHGKAKRLESKSSEMLINLEDYCNYAHNIQLQGVIKMNEGDEQGAINKFEESIKLSKKFDDQINIQNCLALINKIKNTQMS